jgi:hypothetical protein
VPRENTDVDVQEMSGFLPESSQPISCYQIKIQHDVARSLGLGF